MMAAQWLQVKFVLYHGVSWGHRLNYSDAFRELEMRRDGWKARHVYWLGSWNHTWSYDEIFAMYHATLKLWMIQKKEESHV